MQDFLTLAATATEWAIFTTIAIAPLVYAWKRTAPIPTSEFLQGDELAAEGNAELTVSDEVSEAGVASLSTLFAQADAVMSNPIYAADAPATPVKRRRKSKVSQPTQEVTEPCPKPKRGRPRKDAAA